MAHKSTKVRLTVSGKSLRSGCPSKPDESYQYPATEVVFGIVTIVGKDAAPAL